MKRSKIEAYNGIGKDKKLAGVREVDEPETLQECVDIEKADDEENPEISVRDYYWSSKVIEIQRQIRAGTTMSAKAQLAKLLAFAKANPDSEVAKTLVALEITKAEAAKGEGDESKGETTTPPAEKEKEEEKPANTARGRNRK